MYDLCRIFKNQQKVFQKSNLIILDIITARDTAIEQLKLMLEMPFPGGKEEEVNGLDGINVVSTGRQSRNVHEFVLSGSRNTAAIRQELVQSAINF